MSVKVVVRYEGSGWWTIENAGKREGAVDTFHWLNAHSRFFVKLLTGRGVASSMNAIQGDRLADFLAYCKRQGVEVERGKRLPG